MTSKVYRSAQGKSVDMGRLQLQNESVRAVGNMKVNARGDMVDDMNRVISTKSEQVNKQYKKQTTKK
jgi:glycine cleavage system H lipoate-binding protein